MKQCKHCKSVIDDKAKVCPTCQRKQGGKRKYILIAIGVICVIAAVSTTAEDKPKQVASDSATSSPSTTDTAKETSKPTSTPEEKSKFTVGESAEYKDVIVTLNGVTESEGTDFMKPEDGNVFVLANFSFENNSDKELNISSALSFDAYQDGYSTSISITGLAAKGTEQQLDGTIAPGKKMKGVVAYEVPASYKDLEINVKLDVWSSKNIEFIYSK